ncbi:hypothetical protein GCM10025856_16280 [Methylophaga marina]|uniref:DUF2975 domain-containing protein n=1 Tax=Methylophaga marina TaxID=45495 RepID=A0ABP3DHF3_9GAMM|nr:DUF2975 domain-containing protein [Methylophaga marina]BDZ73909.1 hypothetical protein GCM10025856_16280 [Methylophaga marina]
MKNKTNQDRISHFSAQLKLILTTFIILIPTLTLVYWLFFNSLQAAGFVIELPVEITTEIDLITRLLAFLVCLLPITVALYAAVQLRRLFSLYQQGIIFSYDNVICFKRMGLALLAWVIVGTISDTLLSLALTIQNPVGERLLTIGFGSSEMTTLITGSVILVISWVMKEAVEMKHEQEFTV